MMIDGPMLGQLESCAEPSLTPPANSDSSLAAVKSQKPPGNRQLAASYHAEEPGGQSSYH